jgi:hypothetical protein
MATGDHADIPFLQAEKYARGRPDGPPLWIVVHTMQEDELGDRAEAVANYFAFHTGSRSVSSHYTADSNSIVQCVRLADTAWTVGNRPGNNRGINWEFAGRAEQTKAQWADAYSQAMLRLAAPVIRRDMTRYSIPARWCTDADLRDRRPGLTTHAQLGLVFGGTTHWDPGPNFPFDGFLAMIEEDDMGYLAWSNEDRDALARDVWRRFNGRDYVNEKPTTKDHQIAKAHDYSFEGVQLSRQHGETLAAVLEAVTGGDQAAILARIDTHHAEQSARFADLAGALEAAADERDALLELVRQGQSGERDAAAVVDEIGRRLAPTGGAGDTPA